jgi:D-alanyl-D-alanine carboxypeptidase
MPKQHKQVISHTFWGALIIGAGILGGFVVTQAVAGATSLFQKIETDTITHKITETSPVPPTKQAEIKEKQLPPEEAYFKVGNAVLPETDAESFLVADIATGQIIFSHNHTDRRPIASITKLMTALVSKEQLPIKEPTRISLSAIATEGWRGGLEAGQEISIEDLLIPLLLTSSNDAAEAIAESGGRDYFMSRMNAKAKELGMWDTSFQDPSGLSEYNQSTTHDLFLLTQYIYRFYPEIFATTRSNHMRGNKEQWENTSALIREPSFRGGKTGFTYKAKQTSTGVYSLNLRGGAKRDIAIITLGSDQRSKDIRTIITHLENTIHYGTEQSVKETTS